MDFRPYLAVGLAGLLYGAPFFDVLSMYTLGKLVGTGFVPWGFGSSWDSTRIFAVAALARGIGFGASLTGILRARRLKDTKRPAFRALVAVGALNAVFFAEFLFFVGASGCLFNPQDPVSCTVGN